MANAHNYGNYKQAPYPKTNKSTHEIPLFTWLELQLPQTETAAQRGIDVENVRPADAKASAYARYGVTSRHGTRSRISPEIAAATGGEERPSLTFD